MKLKKGGNLFKQSSHNLNMKKRDISGGRVKAVIFDVCGVLNIGANKKKNEIGVHETVAKKMKITLDQYFDTIDTIYVKSIEGELTKSIVYKALALKFNISEKKLKKIYENAYKKHFKLNKGLLKIAKNLKKNGYKIAILSDQWHLSKDVLMPKKEFSIFKNKTVSCDVGMRKPNINIYKMALKKINIKPHEAIFIDDQVWNILPASKLGIKTILFDNNKKFKDQLKGFGVYY